MQHSSRAIANYFLDRAWQSGCSLDAIRIQNLVYIANGWCILRTGEPLVVESFEYWPCGPIEPSLHSQFRRYGIGPVHVFSTHRARTAFVPFAEAETHELLDKVWKVHGGSSSSELTRLTRISVEQARILTAITNDEIARQFDVIRRRERLSLIHISEPTRPY